MNNDSNPALNTYFKSIRNSEKRRYAASYLAHLVSGAADPDVRRYNMRNWSAQDVRIHVDAIVEAIS